MHTSTRDDGDGHIHIFRTDSKAEMIRHAVREFLEDYGAADARLTVDESVEGEGGEGGQGKGWLRIALTLPPTLTDALAQEIVMALDAVIGGGKGWYECRDSGFDPDENRQWWITRHRAGPMI